MLLAGDVALQPLKYPRGRSRRILIEVPSLNGTTDELSGVEPP